MGNSESHTKLLEVARKCDPAKFEAAVEKLKAGDRAKVLTGTKEKERGAILQTCLCSQKPEMVRTYAKYGGNMNTVYQGAASVMSACNSMGSDGCLSAAIEAGMNVKDGRMAALAFIQAAQLESAGRCKLLVEAGVDPNTRSEAGTTPLLAAASHGCPEVVKYLISKGADVNCVCENRASPLFEAAYAGSSEAIMALLEGGATSLDKMYSYCLDLPNSTALHAACFSYTTEVAAVKAIVDAGASIDIKNGEGKTPIEIAQENGRSDLVEMLTSS